MGSQANERQMSPPQVSVPFGRLQAAPQAPQLLSESSVFSQPSVSFCRASAVIEVRLQLPKPASHEPAVRHLSVPSTLRSSAQLSPTLARAHVGNAPAAGVRASRSE